jgi:electron transfer flavoprotein beta subunit
VDRGLETLRLALPAVITTDLRLNTPRYIALPNIMKARQKPIEVKTLEELGILPLSYTTTLSVTTPPARRTGQSLASAAEVVSVLRNVGALNL